LNLSDHPTKAPPTVWRHPETVSSFPHSAGSRPTVVEVDLAALRYNIQNIRARVGQAQIMGIVKANAYGHGLIRTAQELVHCGVEQLGVAFVEEGIVLRQNGITVPILVLGGIIGDQLRDFIEHDLMITASSVYKLDLIEDAAQSLGKRAKIHIKIDTGMERLGIHYYNASQLFEAVLATKHCDLCGVFSHLASSESPDKSFTKLQVERFWRQRTGSTSARCRCRCATWPTPAEFCNIPQRFSIWCVRPYDLRRLSRR
jgi:alanine racemase